MFSNKSEAYPTLRGWITITSFKSGRAIPMHWCWFWRAFLNDYVSNMGSQIHQSLPMSFCVLCRKSLTSWIRFGSLFRISSNCLETIYRGRCQQIYGDGGTNFRGAHVILLNFMKNAAESKKIEWIFNQSSSPHFAGLWEAEIESVKSHLSRVIG